MEDWGTGVRPCQLEDARKTLQFDKVTIAMEGPVIFVTGVAIGSAAEAAGRA